MVNVIKFLDIIYAYHIVYAIQMPAISNKDDHDTMKTA